MTGLLDRLSAWARGRRWTIAWAVIVVDLAALTQLAAMWR